VQHEAGHAGAGVQIRGGVYGGWDGVNGGAVDPPAPDPPLCMTDHPPAYYALIHSPKYLSIQTPPLHPPIHTPQGYIFFRKILFAWKQPFTLTSLIMRCQR